MSTFLRNRNVLIELLRVATAVALVDPARGEHARAFLLDMLDALERGDEERMSALEAEFQARNRALVSEYARRLAQQIVN